MKALFFLRHKMSLLVALSVLMLGLPAFAENKACLPFDMLSRDQVFASPKKVFAHYLSRLPLSFEDVPWTQDYYQTQYLSPNGENGVMRAQGGFLRTRPLPAKVLPTTTYWSPTSDYWIANNRKEISLAIARGIQGFIYNIFAVSDTAPGGYLDGMLQAAKQVDPRFKIVLMPDMTTLGPDTDNVLTIVQAFYNDPALYRLSDGRLVVEPFYAEGVTPAAWSAMLDKAKSMGLNIAFVPTFLWMTPDIIAQYGPISAGLGTFATPIPTQIDYIPSDTAAVQAAGLPYMAGVGAQGYAPHNYLYWEAEGSTAYRNGWMGAIGGNADSVQLTTWNDYSESRQIGPSMDANYGSGTGYYNLTGYYASWFLTGQPPAITHDVLYYFYRKEPVNAAAPNQGQADTALPGSPPPEDIIEVVGFLTAPGTIQVTIGGTLYQKSFDAGLQVFTVPLAAGVPHFSLVRAGSTIVSFDGVTSIAGMEGLASGYSDLTYWSGSGSAGSTCMSFDLAYETTMADSINGQCGSGSGACIAGIPSGISADGLSWMCLGQNGGVYQACSSAPVAAALSTPVAVTSFTQTLANLPSPSQPKHRQAPSREVSIIFK